MKKIFIAVICALILATGTLLLILGLNNKKTSIAFYNIDEKTQNVLIREIEEITGLAPDKIKVIHLSDSEPLTTQLKEIKKAGLLFAQNDFSLQEFCNTSSNPKAIPESFMDDFPVSISDSVNKKNGTVKYIPLLYDFYEVDIDRNLYSNSSIKNINVLSDLTAYLNETSYTVSPSLVFAGGDYKEMLNITGMLYEAVNSPEAYESLLEEFYTVFKSGDIEEYFTRQVSPDGKLYSTIQLLKNYFNEEILSRKCLAMNTDDLLFQIDNDFSINAMYRLSDHRKVGHPKVNVFNSIYCPSIEITANRKFAAPEICGVCLKNNKSLMNVIQQLADNRQTELSTMTGLSPVSKSCSTADKQADDVRYWLAASSGPLIPFSGALPSADAQRTAGDVIKYAITN